MKKEVFLSVIIYLITIFLYHIISGDRDVNYILIILILIVYFILPPILKNVLKRKK